MENTLGRTPGLARRPGEATAEPGREKDREHEPRRTAPLAAGCVKRAGGLLYSLLDTIVDRFFPILDETSRHLEQVEDDVLERPQMQSLQAIHLVKRDLVMIRRIAWPLRELIAQLQRERHDCLSEITQTYFRDVHDHCVQIIELIETYVSISSNRTSDIMKVLTIIRTIFIPLTFLAGVYGMKRTCARVLRRCADG